MITYVTNHHHREVIDGWQLTPTERAEFDYIDWQAVEDGTDSASFVRYRGDLIDLGDVERATGEVAADGWNGFNSDSYWSGIAIRLIERCDEHSDMCAIVARCHW